VFGQAHGYKSPAAKRVNTYRKSGAIWMSQEDEELEDEDGEEEEDEGWGDEGRRNEGALGIAK
jgi:hypothetical protein